MAFKLKSPFNNITNIDGNLPIGKGNVTQRETGVSGMQTGMKYFKVPMAEGDQEITSEPNNKKIDDLVNQADEGIPLGLNPKQQAKFKTRKYKRGLRQAGRERKQTEKARRIYERNQFEAVGGDGAYVDPDKAAGIRSDRAEKELEQKNMQSILESNLPLEEREKQINAIRSKSKFFNDKIIDDKEEKSPPKDNLVMKNKEEKFKNPLLQMKGKPNRAGTPVRMLKSMEDKTPMKYKSVRKTARENLMSALAKQGEPIGKNDLGTPGGKPYSIERKHLNPTSEIKSNPNFATPDTEFKATESGKSNQPKRVTAGDRAKESVKKAIKISVLGPIKDNLYE